jgi:hypothetical protein
MPKARTDRNTSSLKAIFDRMEWVALRCYPNPLRIGCPPRATLERFAFDPKVFPIRDPIFSHVARCSPCARLLLAARQGLR